jgi:pilus assembly protein Flp/PilA
MKNKLLMLSIKLQTLLSNEEGQDLVEYALVVALIAFGAITAMHSLSTELNSVFTSISTSLANAA